MKQVIINYWINFRLYHVFVVIVDHNWQNSLISSNTVHSHRHRHIHRKSKFKWQFNVNEIKQNKTHKFDELAQQSTMTGKTNKKNHSNFLKQKWRHHNHWLWIGPAAVVSVFFEKPAANDNVPHQNTLHHQTKRQWLTKTRLCLVSVDLNRKKP